MFTARLGQLERRQGRLFSWPLSYFGELDEALCIRREEELPVYERLGDVRELIVGHVNLSLMLLKRGREEDTRRYKSIWYGPTRPGGRTDRGPSYGSSVCQWRNRAKKEVRDNSETFLTGLQPLSALGVPVPTFQHGRIASSCADRC